MSAINPSSQGDSGALGGFGGSPRVPKPLTPSRAELAETIRAVEKWLKTFMKFMKDSDALLCALWIVHTHLIDEFYSTPRLLISSPTFGSGKTTLLEHFYYLCREKPAQMGNISSIAVLARIHQPQIRTLLIDEADRTLNAKNPIFLELISIINSGYKRGGTRSVMVPVKGGSWTTEDMPLFAPVAIAGNAPNLPEDTRSRCLIIRLMPSKPGEVRRTLWEDLEPDAFDLRERIVSATEGIREELTRMAQPRFPADTPPRLEEIWRPLIKIAGMAGSEVEADTRLLLEEDLERFVQDSENREVAEAAHVKLVRDIYQIFELEKSDWEKTENLKNKLINLDPYWRKETSPYQKDLTTRRIGMLLSNGFGLNRQRDNEGNRYSRYQFEQIWSRLGISLEESPKPPNPPKPPESSFSEVF
jgi:hypothetical protein